jgi:hypothetical protein
MSYISGVLTAATKVRHYKMCYDTRKITKMCYHKFWDVWNSKLYVISYDYMAQLLAYFTFLTKQVGFPGYHAIRVFPVSILEPVAWFSKKVGTNIVLFEAIPVSCFTFFDTVY